MTARTAVSRKALLSRGLLASGLAALSFFAACGGGATDSSPDTDAGQSQADATGASSGSEAGSGSGNSSGGDGASFGSGSGSGSGSVGDGGVRESGSSSGGQKVPTNVVYNDAGVVMCGTPCPLTANICCISPFGQGTCLATSKTCPAQQAVFKCVQQADCPTGQVCCGVANQTAQTAGAQCQDVSTTGNKCTPVATGASPTQGSAQLCQTNAECKTGTCIWQDCAVGTLKPSLTMCGLQSGAPFNCKAH